MPVNFKHRFDNSSTPNLNIGRIISSGNLTNEEVTRLSVIQENWNFYEGFHWEGIEDSDSPQVTYNYCRTFVDKFTAFELGNGFTFQTLKALEDEPVTINDTKIDTSPDINKDGTITEEEAIKFREGEIKVKTVEKTLFEYVEQVWVKNNREELLEEIGQMKSITGEAWVKVQYISPEDLDDVFEEYPNGRIRLTVVPTQYVFAEYDQHDTKKVSSILIIYPIERREQTGILRNRTRVKTVIYKELWTKDKITVYEDGTEIDSMTNPYGLLPFVQIKNLSVSGRTDGLSDLYDLVPLNTELNIKKSDVSEIIDYHSAPITVVYGAKIGNLEKGANKVWGGMPKDGRVENLSLHGDLVASNNYISEVKTSMCEIGGFPETVLGGAKAISNTSGVALQFMNGPIIDKTKRKKHNTKVGIEKINKLIIFISLKEGLIRKPEYVSMKDFLFNTVKINDTLPKDYLIELQMIQQELACGLECRHGALERLGRDNIQERLNEIDRERAETPELYDYKLRENGGRKLNSGVINSQTPMEEVRKAVTGQNGGAEI